MPLWRSINLESIKTSVRPWQKNTFEKKVKLHSKRRTENLLEISQARDWYRWHPSCASHEGRLGGDEQTTYPPLAVYDGVWLVPKDFKTFKISLAETKPLNADFYGDGINCHIPQNPMATTEVKELMATLFNIPSPKKLYANNFHCARCHDEYVSVDKEKEIDWKIDVHAIFGGTRWSE